MRVQAVSQPCGGDAVRRARDGRLRLRRGAAPAGAAAPLSRGRGGHQLGRPTGVQGRRAEGRPAHARPDRPGPGAAGPSRARNVMISRRSQVIEPFLAVEIFQRAQELERQGKDIIHLEFGEPDFDTPPVVREAAEKALKDGRTRYAHSLGLLPLREAIAEHYRARYGVIVSPEQILVTAGTSPAMLLLFSALLDPGDRVVLSDPHYACYPKFVKYAGAEPVYV